jgi:hypothetical protein
MEIAMYFGIGLVIGVTWSVVRGRMEKKKGDMPAENPGEEPPEVVEKEKPAKAKKRGKS